MSSELKDSSSKVSKDWIIFQERDNYLPKIILVFINWNNDNNYFIVQKRC